MYCIRKLSFVWIIFVLDWCMLLVQAHQSIISRSMVWYLSRANCWLLTHKLFSTRESYSKLQILLLHFSSPKTSSGGLWTTHNIFKDIV